MIIISTILLFVAIFTFGYACGYYTRKEPSQELPKTKGAQIVHRSKPGGIFKEDIPSGPVQRPSADMLKKWNEDPGVTAAKDAMKESFDADPELVKLKNQYNATAKY